MKRPSSSGQKGSTSKKPSTSSPSTIQWTPNGAQLLLSQDQTALFTGKGSITVSNGEVTIFGKAITPSNGPIPLVSGPTPLAITVTAVDATIPLAGSGGAEFSIAGVDSIIVDAENKRSFTLDVSNQAQTATPQSWQQVASDIAASISAAPATAPPAVIAICGPKKVGKSSFARHLLNTLLNSNPTVAYLDTDVGQPEFTPPGLVSLTLVSDEEPVFGPPHVHGRPSEMAHFIGDVSPASDPALYLNAIQSLYTAYCSSSITRSKSKSDRPPPLIVNTHGWVKGTGLDVLVGLLNILDVTHAVHMVSIQATRNLPSGAFWLMTPDDGGSNSIPLTWEIPSAFTNTTDNTMNLSTTTAVSTTAAGLWQHQPTTGSEARSLQWLAFASDCITAMSDPSDTTNTSLGDALAALKPYKIDNRCELTVMTLHNQLMPPATGEHSIRLDQQLRVLNGSIVALCTPPISPNTPPICLGYGIVRAVDIEDGLEAVYLLTPLSATELEKVTILAVGRGLELPIALLQTSQYMSPYLSLFSMSTSGTGAGAVKSRNNLLRSGGAN